jgi:hypothetical protein
LLMDVYHKILARVYEIADGKESAAVDLTDLVKQEGFYASIDSITQRLIDQSWVTETAQRFQVRLTHWGVAEAKRVIQNLPDKKLLVSKDASRLLTECKELVIMLEEFAAEPSNEKLKTIDKRHADIGVIVRRLEGNL